MTKILSLPSELLQEIIEICASRERCHLRATCKVLNELADPIVFRRLCVARGNDSPHITEHQIIALVTRSSNSCEFTKDIEVGPIANGIPSSEESWPYFGRCDDLRVHLPTAMSKLINVTRFRWPISEHDSEWLVSSLMQSVARLPKLTELDVSTWNTFNDRTPPIGLFSNLSKLSLSGDYDAHVPFFISQVSTAIANSPQLRSLTVDYLGVTNDSPLPTLGDFFAKTSTKNPLRLEHLAISCVDATITQTTLPHLMHLSSFQFSSLDLDFTITKSIWTSFLLSNIKLSDVEIRVNLMEETMLYLSSFSGLKRLVVDYYVDDFDDVENLAEMLFAKVLPKHADSLQMLEIRCRHDRWAFDLDTLKSIIKCHKLRELTVITEDSMSMQLLLDTVAHLPKLKLLYITPLDVRSRVAELADFKSCEGLRYVEELWICWERFVLEKDGGPPRYNRMER